MPKIYGYTEILGDILVTGSFSVIGSASTINTTNLVVSDTIISLGHSQSGSPILDEGIMFGRGTGLTQAFIWDESDDTFALVSTNNDHTIIGDVNINSYSNLIVGGLTTSTIKITNGASNGYFLQSDASGNATWASIPVSPLTVGTTPVTSGTNGRLFFQELGIVQQDVSLFWDNTTKRLGIGGSASAPQNTLQVYGSASTFALRVGQNTANSDGVWTGISFFNSTTVTGGNTSAGQANIKAYRYSGGLGGEIEFNVGTSSVMRLVKEGYVSIGSLTASARLDVRAQGVSASDLAFRVRNSTNTDNILVVKGDGFLEVSGTVSTTGFRMTNGSSNGFVLSSNSDGVGSWTASYRDILFHHSTSGAVGDSVTYHVGFIYEAPTTTNLVTRRVRSVYRGEIVSVNLVTMVGSTLATGGENVIYEIHNLTQATYSTITNTGQLNSADLINTYVLSSNLPVSEGDELQFRWITPVFSVNPSSVRHVLTAKLRVY